MTNSTFYVVDTSSFVAMKLNYPMTVFISFWQQCDMLVNEGRLGAPVSVLEELKSKEDDLYSWVNLRRKSLFRDDADFVEEHADVVATFPNIVDPNSDREKADSYVIAMARGLKTQQTFAYEDVSVVTEELDTPKKKNKLKIPEVCKHYLIACIPAPQMTIDEGWVL